MAVILPENSLEQDENWKVREWLKCRESPQYFLQKYVYLQDRNTNQTVNFEPWQHLLDLLSLLLDKQPIIVLKARQIGVSYLVVAYCLWKAKFFENTKALILSKREDDAFDLIDRCKFIDNHLPDFIRTKREPDQRGLIGFPDTYGVIQALPSTEDAGRSTDATIVVCDEWEYHPYAEINYGAVKPTLGQSGQFIAMSTANKLVDISKSFFKTMYNKAKSGDTNMIPRFYNVWSRPDRTPESLEIETKDMPLWMREQEYPETEKQALGTVKSIPFFKPEAIEVLYANATLIPIEHELSQRFRGLVRIYKLPVPGNRYCLFNDPSAGKDDPHAIIVADAVSGEETAESHGKCPAEQCGEIHDSLVRLYNNAFNSNEIQATAGGVCDKTIKDLGTPNRAYRLKTDGKWNDKEFGFFTSDSLKRRMLWDLEKAVRLGQVRPYSKECINEFSQFIQPEGEDPQCPRGGHDDYIIAWAGVWQLIQTMPRGSMKVISFDYA